jgi:predicted nucleic acid-binding protein
VSVVVSDTSPLHYLILCDAVDVLPRLFRQVVIPPTVFQELQQPNTPSPVRAWIQTRPSWVTVQAPSKVDPLLDLDPGEREAICLAEEIHAAAILMDDQAGRVAARRRGLAVTGTVGVLELAAARNLVELPAVLGRLQQTNARLDPDLVRAAIERDTARQERERGESQRRGTDPQP